jgi:hypothetical protein
MNEQWQNIMNEAAHIADVAMEASSQLDRCAQRIQTLIAVAADTPIEPEREEAKRDTIRVWRETVVSLRNAQDALTTRGSRPIVT